jgi:hypothetical protein
MSNGNGAVAATLGAGGGLLLWYFLTYPKKRAIATTPAEHAVPSTSAPTNTTTGAAAGTSSLCTLRLDARGLTADGVRVGIDDAVNRCKSATRAQVTVTTDAPAAAYMDLSVALSRAGVPVTALRNAGSRRRRAQPEAVADVDLETFARVVRELADKIETDTGADGRPRGRFGQRKVFIAAIRRALLGTELKDLPRSTVDTLLVRAHRAGLLELARADLVAAMDQNEVRDSEVITSGASFHFVISERDRNAAHVRDERPE